MQNLQIQLLGNFNIHNGEDFVKSIKSQRLQDFLVYLLLHKGVPQTRPQLSYLFWPESSDTQAYTNLRNLIYLFRKSFPAADEFFTVDNQYILWRESPSISLDVDKFELLAELASQYEINRDPESWELILESAINLYKGDLVPSCYADWINPHRARFRTLNIRSLERLVSVKEMRGNYEEAIEVARRLLNFDPLNEGNYRILIRLFSLIGDRAAAVRSYYDCVEVMQRELDVEPSITTRQLYEQLTRKDFLPQQQKLQIPGFSANIPLVGRQQEWNQLLASWQKASGGDACFTLIIGENGFGKTRLGEEFIHWAEQNGVRTASARCYPADSNLGYTPIVAWLRSRPLPVMDNHQLTEIARICPELLLERPAIAKPAVMSEKWQLQHFFEALKHALFFDYKPLILFLDDLQWIDEESLEWIYFMLRFAGHLPLLIVATLCPENLVDREYVALFLSAIRRSGQLSEVELPALTKEQTSLLASHLSGSKISSSRASILYQETEGIPLFIVELIRSGWVTNRLQGANDVDHHPTCDIPPVVQTAIKNRLADLSPQAQELIGLAAMIGYKFTFPVLATASGMPEDLLLRALDELIQRRILRETNSETYHFCHGKLQEVTYASLSSVKRRIFHHRVADAVNSCRPVLDPSH